MPLLQVQRSKDKEGQTDPVKTLLGMGNSEASSPLEQELPREERELLHQALKEALQPSYRLSELMPQEMRAQVQESIQALKNARTQSEEQNPLTIRHVLTDHLGTPIALVNANGEQQGQVAWAAIYTAWGQVEEEYNSNEIHQPIRFQGQQLDPETGLHYNRFRYYDPKVGQYITQDPIGLLGGDNLTRYALNTPANATDPTGLIAPIVFIGMAILGGGLGAGANYAKQKLVDKKCDADMKEVANAWGWGAFAGVLAPVAAVSSFPVAASAALGGVAGAGQYTTGSLLSGQEITSAGILVNGGMGAIGGGIAGPAARGVGYGAGAALPNMTPATAWPELARQSVAYNQLASNATMGVLSRNAAGAFTGQIDPRAVETKDLCCSNPCK